MTLDKINDCSSSCRGAYLEELSGLDHYYISKEEKIGSGSFATVYECRNKTNDKVYALKIIKKEHKDDQADFYTEIGAGNIQHPNIITYISYGEIESVFYVLMEFVPQILEDIISKISGRMEFNRVIDLSIQLSQAISAIHEQNIYHRDIKPNNIGMKDNKLILFDFGVAHLSNLIVTRTKTNRGIGTPSYSAPEQFIPSLGEIDHRSDIYSLGAVMFELLNGEKHRLEEDYDANRVNEWLMQPMRNSNKRFFSKQNETEACSDLIELIGSCLNPVIDERIKNINIVLEKLEKIKIKFISNETNETPSKTKIFGFGDALDIILIIILLYVISECFF